MEIYVQKKSSYVLLLFCLQNKTQKKRRSEKRLSKKLGG
jgi:phage-related protein